MIQVAQGGTATLRANYRDGNGDVVDPVNPRVSILDPHGTVIVGNAVPTRLPSGTYEYDYAVASNALLGDWSIQWSGQVNGVNVEGTDTFQVVTPGSIVPPTAQGAQTPPCSVYTSETQVRALVAGIDPNADLTQWIVAASQILWTLTGRQYDGLCTATIRPSHEVCTCSGGCSAHSWGWPGLGGFWGYGGTFLIGPPWGGLGYGWGSQGQILGCSWEILLGSNAREITSIKIDGVEVDSTTYRLDPGGRLIRVQPDPNGVPLWWPCCESPAAPSGAPGTFEVTFTYGFDPPQMVVLAAAVLAGEMALGANPSTAAVCKLPRHVQTMTRQGVTATFVTDVSTILDKGYTGIPIVDQAIAATNINHLKRRARVLTPDLPPHRLMKQGP